MSSWFATYFTLLHLTKECVSPFVCSITSLSNSRRGWFDYRHGNRNTDFGIKKTNTYVVYLPQTSFDLHSMGGVLY
jgi:hypothetical protein